MIFTSVFEVTVQSYSRGRRRRRRRRGRERHSRRGASQFLIDSD
jgi:hypothetical protein